MTTPPHNNTPDETAMAMAVYRRLPVTADGVRVIPTVDDVWCPRMNAGRLQWAFIVCPAGHYSDRIAKCYFHHENIPQEPASE